MERGLPPSGKGPFVYLVNLSGVYLSTFTIPLRMIGGPSASFL